MKAQINLFRVGGPTAKEKAETIVNRELTEGRVSRAINQYNRKVEKEAGPVIEHSRVNNEL